ncbi:MAG: hypothetical protein ACTSU4_08145 [Promethearchaeota archaeon]
MLIVIYFNRILGAEIYFTIPENLSDDLGEEIMDQIKSLIYTEEEGFFTHNFSKNIKTANLIFKLDSKWARGRTELILISIILSEEEPDYGYYEKILNDLVVTLREYPDLYKAFYLTFPPPSEKEKVIYAYNLLTAEFQKFYKSLALKNIETEGMLINFKNLQERKSIPLSFNFLSRIREASRKKQNYFIGYRMTGDSIKIEVIPINETTVQKIMILFGEQTNINIIHQISKIFSEHENSIKLIYTAGACRELDKCLYEVYVHLNDEQYDQIRDEIEQIPGILGIKKKEIKLNEHV